MTRIIAVVLGITIFFLCSGNQSGEGFSKEDQKLLKEADFSFDITDYYSALNLYKKIHKRAESNPYINYKIGASLFKLGKNKLDAIPYLQTGLKDENNYEAHYYLACCYHLQENFDKAIEHYERYKNASLQLTYPVEEINRLIEISLRAKKAVKDPLQVSIQNLGSTINTKYSEYVPLISAEEDVLIFTARKEDSYGGLKDPYGEYFEDIYVSKKENDSWGIPMPVGGSINTATHDACVGLSSDGKILMLYRTNEWLTGGDLYYSINENSEWTAPRKFAPTINSSDYQEASASITVDGNVMYFSSNRPGGYGGKDIYRSIRFGNGDWSLPINLGPTINTAYDEDGPFIHPDGKTLYFSSKAHTTIGGYDIFKSTKGENKLWSRPENIGHPINTANDDIYFVTSPDGERGYLSSEREGGFGGQDIYMISIPEPTPTYGVIKGNVFGSDSLENPVKAKITLVDNDNMILHGIYHSDAADGKYVMVLEPDVSYQLLVEANGYHSKSQELRFDARLPVNEINMNFKLKPNKLEEGSGNEYLYSYTMENVYFNSDQHHLKEESYSTFTSLVEAMKENKNMVVEIVGHTDNTGNSEANQALSEARANSVKEYLITQGCESNRIMAKGMGDKNPVASNDTEKGKALNRRTEIRVINE